MARKAHVGFALPGSAGAPVYGARIRFAETVADLLTRPSGDET